MKAGVPSRTAFGVAIRRAVHQILDQPVVFEDPLAIRIVGEAASTPSITARHRGWRQLRAFVAARSRYAEDELAAFFAEGVRQYVVLGAGLDTFAYRNPYSPPLKVFEVDHPDTQAWKTERIHAAGIAIPDSLTFVPLDFEQRSLAEALGNAAGFSRARPAFFSMLGVTPYLTNEALMTTLKFVVSMSAGSGIVFDYAVPAASLRLVDKVALKILAGRVEKAGEAFRLFLDPQTLCTMLGELGFTRMKDLGREEINARYFRDRRDGLRIRSGLGRIMSARRKKFCG